MRDQYDKIWASIKKRYLNFENGIISSVNRIFCENDQEFATKKIELQEKFGEEYSQIILSKITQNRQGQWVYSNGEMSVKNKKAIDDNQKVVCPNLTFLNDIFGFAAATKGAMKVAREFVDLAITPNKIPSPREIRQTQGLNQSTTL